MGGLARLMGLWGVVARLMDWFMTWSIGLLLIRRGRACLAMYGWHSRVVIII